MCRTRLIRSSVPYWPERKREEHSLKDRATNTWGQNGVC